jgi:Cof subfamily protein (haloacid dehalogenase superfamily)
MGYKLVVIDMDGTLLNSEDKVSEENKRVLKELHKKGVHVAIATGRIYTTARVYAKYLGIVTPLISSNGAMVKNLENDEKIYANPLSKEKCIKIIDTCRENNLHFYFFSEDTIFGERLEKRLLYFSEWGKTLKEEDRIKVEVVKDSKEIVAKEVIYKFGIQSDNIDALNFAIKELKSNLDIEAKRSWMNIVDVTNKGVSKGNAVKNLAQSLGIKREEVIAIGDNENDISMLEYAGLGIAMANAKDSIKKIADYTTDTNDNDGVAKAIKKFVL